MGKTKPKKAFMTDERFGCGRVPFLKLGSRILDVSTGGRTVQSFSFFFIFSFSFSFFFLFWALTARLCLGEDNLSHLLYHSEGIGLGVLVVTETQYGTTSGFETQKIKKISGVAPCANGMPGNGLKRYTTVRWRLADFSQGRSKWAKLHSLKKGCGSTCGTKNCFLFLRLSFLLAPFFSPPLGLSFILKIWETSSHGGEAGVSILTVVFLHGRCSAPCISMSRKEGF